jgi:hypothetical protein
MTKRDLRVQTLKYVIIIIIKNTRWFKYDRDYLCVNKSNFVPVIFEPPCTKNTKIFLGSISYSQIFAS